MATFSEGPENESVSELIQQLNQIFDSCLPDPNDLVNYEQICKELTNQYLGSSKELTNLKKEFKMILGSPNSMKISRREFLKAMTSAYSSVKPNISPKTPTFDKSVELQDLRRSLGIEKSSESLESSLMKEQDLNLHLTNVIKEKDCLILALRKENECLRKDLLLQCQNHDEFTSAHDQQITRLKDQVYELNANYKCYKEAALKIDQLEGVVEALEKQKASLNREFCALESNYLKTLSQNEAVELENRNLQNELATLKEQLVGEKVLIERMEELRSEKQGLTFRLASFAESTCPMLMEFSEDEISPDSMKILCPEGRQQGMSIEQELAMLPQVQTRDQWTSCEDLQPLAVDCSMQTDPQAILKSLGIQTDCTSDSSSFEDIGADSSSSPDSLDLLLPVAASTPVLPGEAGTYVLPARGNTTRTIAQNSIKFEDPTPEPLYISTGCQTNDISDLSPAPVRTVPIFSVGSQTDELLGSSALDRPLHNAPIFSAGSQTYELLDSSALPTLDRPLHSAPIFSDGSKTYEVHHPSDSSSSTTPEPKSLISSVGIQTQENSSNRKQTILKQIIKQAFLILCFLFIIFLYGDNLFRAVRCSFKDIVVQKHRSLPPQ